MPAGVATTTVARRAGVPAVVTFSSGELIRIDDIAYGLQRRWFDRRAIARVLREAAAITVPTSYMARFPALDGVTPTIVPVGIDTAASNAGSRARVDGPPWRLVRVGSINAVKDHRTLLHAVAALPAAVRAEVRLDIVGEDTLGGAMQALASRLGLTGHVTFHGWQPTEGVRDFFARAHLHVMSSRHEASSVTMLEAAALGVPTVGTAVGYVADWQPDRAVAVPVNDPPALAHAIQTLLQDPDRRARIARAARAWTLTHDADWTARAFERVYEGVTRR
jgi:glycosyltransferase involved in cell wall biosynthesis